MMMSASVLKRKDVAKNFSFTGIDIKILKEEIMQGSKCCTYIILIQELHVFGDEQGRDAIKIMISSPSDIDFLI